MLRLRHKVCEDLNTDIRTMQMVSNVLQIFSSCGKVLETLRSAKMIFYIEVVYSQPSYNVLLLDRGSEIATWYSQNRASI